MFRWLRRSIVVTALVVGVVAVGGLCAALAAEVDVNRNSSRTPPEAVKRYLDEAIRVIRARRVSGIGYVSVPAFGGGSAKRNTAFADALLDELQKRADAGARRWIVDLRSNGGGNMHPMNAGLSTSNEMMPLSDGAMLLLTTAVFADRTGKAYSDRITPDVAVGDPEGATSEASVTLREAVSWLRAQPGCSRG